MVIHQSIYYPTSALLRCITHDIHNLLHVSAPRCHLHGVITKKSVQANLQICVLFVLISIRVRLLEYIKLLKKYKIDSTDSLQYSDVLYYTDHKPPQLSVLSCFHMYGWCIQMPGLIPYDLE